MMFVCCELERIVYRRETLIIHKGGHTKNPKQTIVANQKCPSQLKVRKMF